MVREISSRGSREMKASSDDDDDDGEQSQVESSECEEQDASTAPRFLTCAGVTCGTLLIAGGAVVWQVFSSSQPSAPSQTKVTRHSESSAPLQKIVARNESSAPSQKRVVRKSRVGHAFTTLTTTSPFVEGLCNLSMPKPPLSKVHRIHVAGEWRSKCKTEWHGDHWEPLANMTPRNWCWVNMKATNFECTYTDPQLDPPNWWWTQHATAEKGLAPNPADQILHPLTTPELCDLPQSGFTPDVEKGDWDKAWRWVKDNVAFYVLNLDIAKDRLNKMRWRFQSLGFDFTRVAGADLRAPNALQDAKARNEIPMDWDYDLLKENSEKQYAITRHDQVWQETGLGTVGCTAGHLRAMSIAANLTSEADKPIAVILEDDVSLVDDFALKFWHMLHTEAPCDWEAISLKSYMPYGDCISTHLSRVRPDANEPEERCRKGANWGFFAVAYRVDKLRHIIQELSHTVWDTSRPTCLQQDIALAFLSDKIAYYAVSATQRPGFLTMFGSNDESRESINKGRKDWWN